MRGIGTEFKKMFSRVEFYLTVCLCVAYAGAAFLELLPRYSGLDASVAPSAWLATMLNMKSGMGQTFLMVLVPLFAALGYADGYFQEAKSGAIVPHITRMGKQNYFLSKAVVAAVSAFGIVLFTLLFNQLLAAIAFPWKGVEPRVSGTVYEASIADDLRGLVFPRLYMNAPVLYNLVIMFMAGVWGAVTALLAYAISLYFRKNLITVLGSVTLLNAVVSLGLSVVSARAVLLLPSPYLFADPYMTRSVWGFVGGVAVCLCAAVALIAYKIKKGRDMVL